MCYDFGVEHIISGTTLECCLTIWDTNTEYNPSDIHIIQLETDNPYEVFTLQSDVISSKNTFIKAIYENIITRHNK